MAAVAGKTDADLGSEDVRVVMPPLEKRTKEKEITGQQNRKVPAESLDRIAPELVRLHHGRMYTF